MCLRGNLPKNSDDATCPKSGTQVGVLTVVPTILLKYCQLAFETFLVIPEFLLLINMSYCE